MTHAVPGGGLVKTLYSLCAAHPATAAAVVIPAAVVAAALGMCLYLGVTAYGKDCLGDKALVPLPSHVVTYTAPGGTVTFTVQNPPASGELCITPINRDQAMLTNHDMAFAWADWSNFKKLKAAG